MTPTSHAASERGSSADQLVTPKPDISPTIAGRIGHELFGFGTEATPLTGERDSNFLMTGQDGTSCVLKFVNAAEPELETDFQIALLRHLALQDVRAIVPTHVPALGGQDHITARDRSGLTTRVRAYTYLAGLPAVAASSTAAHRRALGRTLGMFDQALQGFDHPGLQRDILWNVMQLGQLAPLVRHVRDVRLQQIAANFIACFDSSVLAALSDMRRQAIHNDLSLSNYLVDPARHERIVGILDFGDALAAPLIVDPAIAASYQMSDAEEPIAAMHEVLEGFTERVEITEEESRHMVDLTMARVVQRLVLTEWRAARFPENRDYILRHNAAAQRLAVLLEPHWMRTSLHAPRPQAMSFAAT